MTRRFTAAAVLAAALITITAAPGAAQTSVALSPPDLPRWDLSGHLGWFGNRPDVPARDWDDWYGAAEASVSAGYHFTRNVKLELGAATTSEGDVYAPLAIALPGQPYPFYASQRHYIRTSAVSTGVAYQFLENAWFHPFLGAGIEMTHESRRTETEHGYLSPIDPRRALVPVASTPSDGWLSPRPYATAGFKWYVTERTFVRSEVRSAFGSGDGTTLTWRAGVGFDF